MVWFIATVWVTNVATGDITKGQVVKLEAADVPEYKARVCALLQASPSTITFGPVSVAKGQG